METGTTNRWASYFTSNCPTTWKLEDLSTTDRGLLEELYKIMFRCGGYHTLPRSAQKCARILSHQILDSLAAAPEAFSSDSEIERRVPKRPRLNPNVGTSASAPNSQDPPNVDPVIQEPSMSLRGALEAYLRNNTSPKISSNLDLGRFFIDPLNIDEVLPKEWVAKLNKSVPASTAAPDFFMQCLRACEDYIKDPSVANFPSIPDSASTTLDRKTWTYVHNSVTHFQENFVAINGKCGTSGEVWADVNIWGHVFDTAYIQSSSLTLDRRETESNASSNPSGAPDTQKQYRYDGIIRTHTRTGSGRRDFGFIEAKPVRVHENSKKDRGKVEDAMASSLRNIHASILPKDSLQHTTDIVVVGIVCDGMSITILRAWKMHDLLIFKEGSIDLCLDRLTVALEICWRLKLDLEKSCETVRALVEKVRSCTD